MKKQQEHNKPEYPTEAYGAIPAFNNIEEEAEFWDTHDTTEFEEEFKPVKVRFAKNLKERNVMAHMAGPPPFHWL